MRSSKGFTLIEVMVVVAIFSILTGVILANFRGSSRAQNLRASADALAARIKSAQSRAAANAQQEVCSLDNKICRSGSNCDAGYPANCVNRPVPSYGIFVRPQGSGNDYTLFADMANPGTYDSGETVPGGVFQPERDVEIVSIFPPANNPVVYTYNAANSSPFVSCAADCTTTIVLRERVADITAEIVIKKQTGIITIQ